MKRCRRRLWRHATFPENRRLKPCTKRPNYFQMGGFVHEDRVYCAGPVYSGLGENATNRDGMCRRFVRMTAANRQIVNEAMVAPAASGPVAGQLCGRTSRSRAHLHRIAGQKCSGPDRQPGSTSIIRAGSRATGWWAGRHLLLGTWDHRYLGPLYPGLPRLPTQYGM
ncbi:hypothetical protein GQ53DRAFT_505381 [Thozetella sp. PMI_491]|nr:hypothetical protein GQ53DRAFT_505381 [Thozetella sp. PMI_491]